RLRRAALTSLAAGIRFVTRVESSVEPEAHFVGNENSSAALACSLLIAAKRFFSHASCFSSSARDSRLRSRYTKRPRARPTRPADLRSACHFRPALLLAAVHRHQRRRTIAAGDSR